MSHLESNLCKAPLESFGGDGVERQVPIPADPLANARAWLAAMKISLQRTAQQVTEQPAEQLADARAWFGAPGDQFLGNSRQCVRARHIMIYKQGLPSHDADGLASALDRPKS